MCDFNNAQRSLKMRKPVYRVTMCLPIYGQRHGLAVPRAGDRSYVTGSIRS